MYTSSNIAARIKAVAKSKNVSIKKLLEDVGLGYNTMTNMKTSTPKADNIAKIADYLGVSVDYLLGRTDDPLGGIADDVTEDLVVYNRNGKVIRKKMSKDAMRLLTSMLDALPEDDNPDL